MCAIRSFSGIGVIILMTLAPHAATQEVDTTSPRLRELSQKIAASPTAALEQFWQEMEGNCPLVEPIADDDQHLLVTFLWRGDASIERIEVHGGPYASSREPFARIGTTDVWFHSERLPLDSRYVYGLVVHRRLERQDDDGTLKQVVVEEFPDDPLNPRKFNAGPVVELPDAPKDAWHIADESAAKGRIERFTIASEILNGTRTIAVYVPCEFDSAESHRLALFLDGMECEKLMDLATVFDNLIGEKRIAPTVVVMIDSQATRGRDLLFSVPFVNFMANELVPWTIEKYRLRVTADQTLIGGVSLGGLTAAYAAHERPEVFGNVLSQSGAFWRVKPETLPTANGRGWFPDYVNKSKPTSVRYYLEVGQFEAPTMIDNNRGLRDVLQKQGNKVFYDEYNGGHDHVNWRVSVGRGLMALLGQNSGPR